MPSRRAYTVAACAATALAIYGSLVPFRYTPIELTEALERFRAAPYLQVGPGGRADWVANILLFIPLGYLWLGAIALDVTSCWRRLIAAGLVVGALAAGSVALEFAQIWFPPRTVSRNDIVAEALGGAAGAVLWLLTGQATAEWLRALARERRPADRFARLLVIYTAGLAVYAVLPLDLTLSAGELFDKLREGRLTLVPFADARWEADSLYGIVRDIVVFIPVGMLIAVWGVRPPARVRPVWMGATGGAGVAVALEAAQVVVVSRYASTTDVLLGGAGALVGASLMAWLYAGRYGTDSVEAATPAVRRALAWAAGAMGVAVVIAAVFLAPFEVAGTATEWRERYEGFWAVPFARLYYGSEFNAISDVLRKLILFGLLAGAGTRAVMAFALPRRVEWLMAAAVVAGGAGLAFAIEIAQVLLPPRVPDVTDVLLGAIGGAIGAAVSLAVRSDSGRP